MNAIDFDIAKLKALDPAEWERLQREYFPRVYYFVKRQVAHHEAAEDITSETFLGAFRGIDRFDERYNVEQYLFGIARKKAIDWMRRQGHETNISGRDDDDSSNYFAAVPADTPTASQVALAREKVFRQRDALVQILKHFVATLWETGDFQRLKCIELVFLCHWKHRDVSDLLGYIDEKAVAGVKFRAIRDMQELLRARDPNRSLFSRLWE